MRRSERARWLQARTRNAARHTLLMGGVGSVVLVAALLTFVLVPRQVDRTLAAALAAAPQPRDTTMLLEARARAERTLAAAQAQQARARAERDSLAALMVGTDSATGAVAQTDEAALRELRGLMARAAQAPLVESYRALAGAGALGADRETRVLLDSIERVHRERESWATPGGPDARYAALTEQLTRLGTRLGQRAAEILAARRGVAPIPDSARSTGDSSVSFVVAVDTDSLLTALVQASAAALTRADSAIVAARAFNASVQQQRASLRTRLQVAIPPQAMLLASLVLAVSAGFAAGLWRELRRPTVGDADELETLTGARVIVHRAEAGRRSTGKAARGMLSLADEAEVWPTLHVLLSRIGDVARRVQVIADQSALAEVVALRLAVTASRASRATVLVDAVAGGVRFASPGPQTDGRPPATDGSPWQAPRPLGLDRDLSLDVIRPRGPLRHASTPGAADVTAGEALAALVARYDLAVLVADAASAPTLPGGTDVVLCAREGVTPLAWLSRAVASAAAEGRPVRAVLLWSGELPLAG